MHILFLISGGEGGGLFKGLHRGEPPNVNQKSCGKNEFYSSEIEGWCFMSGGNDILCRC